MTPHSPAAAIPVPEASALTPQAKALLARVTGTVRTREVGDIIVHKRADIAQNEFNGRDPLPTLARAIPHLEAQCWWVGDGTALGLIRDGAPIPWDTDVDLRLRLDFRAPRVAAETCCALTDSLSADGFDLMRVLLWRGRVMQFAFVDRRNADVILDLFGFHAGRTPGVLVNAMLCGMLEKPEHLIENRVALPVPGLPQGHVPVPGPAEAYCAWRYGSRWRIPTTRDQMTRADEPNMQPLPAALTG